MEQNNSDQNTQVPTQSVEMPSEQQPTQFPQEQKDNDLKIFLLIGAVFTAFFLIFSFAIFLFKGQIDEGEGPIASFFQDIARQIEGEDPVVTSGEIENEELMLNEVMEAEIYEQPIVEESIVGQPIVEEQVTSSQAPVAKNQPEKLGEPDEPEPTCYGYEITKGDFKSDQCYTRQDRYDLGTYINKYNSALFEYDSAKNMADFTCDGSDFFEDQCEDAKDRMEDAEDELDKYENKIEDILDRGWDR